MQLYLAAHLRAAIVVGFLIAGSTTLSYADTNDSHGHSHEEVVKQPPSGSDGKASSGRAAETRPPADDHTVFEDEHATHHRPGQAQHEDRLPACAHNPVAIAGLALALLAIGMVAGAALRRRAPTLARLTFAGSLVIAAASIAGGMVLIPGEEHAPEASVAGKADDHEHDHDKGHEEGHEREGAIAMPAERIAASGIVVEKAAEGSIARRLSFPGALVPDANKQARVPAQVVGTVAELRKRIGDEVAAGEVIALISSREVADAKSEFLAAVVNLNLQKTLYERSAALWEKRVTPEQQYLQVKANFTQAELRVDLARQKLSSLGLDPKVVETEAKEDSSSSQPSRLRTYEVRAPMAGRIVERKVEVGTPVGKEGDASELYAIADLSTVWADLSVPVADLNLIKEGQVVQIADADKTAEGKIVFVSPIVNAETRSARVVASFKNDSFEWRPGTFVTARVLLEEEAVGVRVPVEAVQTVEGKQAVFVRTTGGFQQRQITTGRSDGRGIEVLSGLNAGEEIAVKNTFVLKADLGKAEAEHSH